MNAQSTLGFALFAGGIWILAVVLIVRDVKAKAREKASRVSKRVAVQSATELHSLLERGKR